MMLSFAEGFYLVVLAIVGYLFARALANFAVVADMPTPPPRKSLAWVHFGLIEPQPWDGSAFGRTPDEIYDGRWAGETTGVWPMVLELKDEPYEPELDEPSVEPSVESVESVDTKTAAADDAATPKARDRFARSKVKGGRRKVTVDVGGDVREAVMAG